MIRLFGHYVSPALLGLLGLEALLLLGSLSIGQILWRAWDERGVGPALAAILANALAGTLVLSAILIALGLYERQFWRG